MAYTFEELEAWYPGKSYPIADITFYVVQEDGRALYAGGFINNFQPNRFSGQMTAYFNDRTRQLPGPGGNYRQIFDAHPNEVDLVDFVFSRIGPAQFRLNQTLLRWGNAQLNVDLLLANYAKLYLGTGTTIGGGAGQALNALTIVNAVETPG